MSNKKNSTETQSSEMTESIFNNSVESNSNTAVNNADSAKTESSTSAMTASASESKQQRVGIRQRRLDFEEYKTTYLSQKALANRKQTNISRDLYDRIALMVRRLGDIDSTVSGFVDSVLLRHMDDYAADHDIWRKL